MQSYLKDEHKFEVVETPVYEVGEDGNVSKRNHKLHLEKDGIQLTRDYWNIIELWDDHYVVCDLNASGCYLDDINEYTIESEIAALEPQIKFQFGVIKIQRNEKGEVVPFTEKTIVPIMYDRISENNEDSLTAYSNGKLTYIDLNPKSSIMENKLYLLFWNMLSHSVLITMDLLNVVLMELLGIYHVTAILESN